MQIHTITNTPTKCITKFYKNSEDITTNGSQKCITMSNQVRRSPHNHQIALKTKECFSPSLKLIEDIIECLIVFLM